MTIYNFSNILTLTCDFNGHKGYEKYFNNEYLRITGGSTSSKASTKISVNIVRKLPNEKSGDLLRQARYKKLFTYNYLIRGLASNNVEIFFERHWVDKVYMNAIGVFLQAQVLEPIMYLKLLEQNVLLMHAGGVAKDGKGYLLPAYGGTGKTTFSIALMNHGFKLLGDDLLLVDINKKIVHPYPRPLHVFTYNVQNLNGAKIPLKYKVAVYGKNILRFFLEKILRTEFLISTRIHADEIFEGDLFATAVPYSEVFFLRKNGKDIVPTKITKNNVNKIALGIMESEDLNDSLYELVDDKDMINDIKKLEEEVIVGLLKQFSKICYVNTRKLDLNNLNDVIEKYFK